MSGGFIMLGFASRDPDPPSGVARALAGTGGSGGAVRPAGGVAPARAR